MKLRTSKAVIYRWKAHSTLRKIYIWIHFSNGFWERWYYFSFVSFWNTKQIGFNFATFIIFHFLFSFLYLLSSILLPYGTAHVHIRLHKYTNATSIGQYMNKPFPHFPFVLTNFHIIYSFSADYYYYLIDIWVCFSSNYCRVESLPSAKVKLKNLKWETCPDIHNGKC